LVEKKVTYRAAIHGMARAAERVAQVARSDERDAPGIRSPGTCTRSGQARIA
jgi:hypothetical protein